MNPKRLRQLADAFAVVEPRECMRQHGEAFAAWLHQFSVPLDDVPQVSDGEATLQSVETEYCFPLPFFDWWIDGESVVGRPRIPNDSESGLPRDQSVGYRIPRDSLETAPKVKRKHGHRDADGYVVLAY